jgi:hypothetical protein
MDVFYENESQWRRIFGDAPELRVKDIIERVMDLWDVGRYMGIHRVGQIPERFKKQHGVYYNPFLPLPNQSFPELPIPPEIEPVVSQPVSQSFPTIEPPKPEDLTPPVTELLPPEEFDSAEALKESEESDDTKEFRGKKARTASHAKARARGHFMRAAPSAAHLIVLHMQGKTHDESGAVIDAARIKSANIILEQSLGRPGSQPQQDPPKESPRLRIILPDLDVLMIKGKKVATQNSPDYAETPEIAGS